MWRKSDVKINFKHFKIYFYCLRVTRRNIGAWFCCVAAGNLQNCLISCRDATFRPYFVASLCMQLVAVYANSRCVCN